MSSTGAPGILLQGVMFQLTTPLRGSACLSQAAGLESDDKVVCFWVSLALHLLILLAAHGACCTAGLACVESSAPAVVVDPNAVQGWPAFRILQVHGVREGQLAGVSRLPLHSSQHKSQAAHLL